MSLILHILEKGDCFTDENITSLKLGPGDFCIWHRENVCINKNSVI